MSTFINASHIYEAPGDRPLRVPTDRFTDLLTNVFKKHGTEYDAQSVMRGPQYSNLEILAQAFAERPISEKTEVLVFTTSALEFDPKQTGMGAAFQARFGRYELHAVVNEGILGGFTALKLASKIAKHQGRKVSVIAVEQSTNPLPKGYAGFIPSENVVASVDLTTDVASPVPEILFSAVVHLSRLPEKLVQLEKTYGLNAQNVRLNIATEQSMAECLTAELREAAYQVHPFKPSSAQVVQLLESRAQDRPYSLILLEDVFSHNCGVLLLKESGL